MSAPAIVACHDCTQLVTALAVLSERKAQGPRILVIHELWSDDEKALEGSIRRLAETAGPWERIVFIDRGLRETLAKNTKGFQLAKTLARLRALLGADTAAELYLCREWQFGNRLLLAAYPGARRYCYGDGPGIYLSERYHDPSAPFLTTLSRGARRAATALLATVRLALPQRSHFHGGYFLFPDALEKPPMRLRPLAPRTVRATVERLSREVTPPPLASGETALLLTSNFSDWRMERANEIRAYLDLVKEADLPSGTRLLIKPHPREPRQKSELLRRELARFYPSTAVWEEERHTPVELLYAALPPPKPLVITLGATALSLPLLFGATVRFGFGENAVRRYFRHEHRAGRLRFERDLARAAALMADRAQSMGAIAVQ